MAKAMRAALAATVMVGALGVPALVDAPAAEATVVHPDGSATLPLSDSMVERFYLGVFNRRGDRAGVEHWERVAGERGIEVAVAGMLRSFEFSVRHGQAAAEMSDAEFVAVLYRTALWREPDPVGWQWWVDRLFAGRFQVDQSVQPGIVLRVEGGMSRAGVVLAVLGSVEFERAQTEAPPVR